MPVDISVQGADELAVIARHLKLVGDGGLRKELFRGLNKATKPVRADMKRSALANLPKRGGLNTLIAGSKFGAANRSTGRNPGVRISVKLAGHDVRSIDAGQVRHPVFGRDVWVVQPIEPGVFSTPFDEHADEIRRELLDVLEGVARQVVDGR